MPIDPRAFSYGGMAANVAGVPFAGANTVTAYAQWSAA
jgi:hypothetical protein